MTACKKGRYKNTQNFRTGAGSRGHRELRGVPDEANAGWSARFLSPGHRHGQGQQTHTARVVPCNDHPDRSIDFYGFASSLARWFYRWTRSPSPAKKIGHGGSKLYQLVPERFEQRVHARPWRLPPLSLSLSLSLSLVRVWLSWCQGACHIGCSVLFKGTNRNILHGDASLHHSPHTARCT